MKKAKDPVCGMAVDTKNPPAQTLYHGKTYYFCAPGCKEAFEEDPKRFVEELTEDHPPGQSSH